jgi:hypothetical protein
MLWGIWRVVVVCVLEGWCGWDGGEGGRVVPISGLRLRFIGAVLWGWPGRLLCRTVGEEVNWGSCRFALCAALLRHCQHSRRRLLL